LESRVTAGHGKSAEGSLEGQCLILYLFTNLYHDATPREDAVRMPTGAGRW
jgi:hypothetical protein